MPSALASFVQDILEHPNRDLILAALGAALLVFVALLTALVRSRSRRKESLGAPSVQTPSPEAKTPERVELPPSPEELARREEARRKRDEADRLAEEKRAREAAAKDTKDAAERERLESEARALKHEVEEKRKEEYRAKKAAEAEERDRKRREVEEAERLQREAEQQARAEAAAHAQQAREEEARRIAAQAGQTLSRGLEKTRNQGFVARLNAAFGQSKNIDESILGELEEILFTADIGVRTASSLVEMARERLRQKELQSTDKLKDAIRREVERIVALPGQAKNGGHPHVLMVVGVNGSGKTTTIGKLAAKLSKQGKRVILAAGDTFRAAAAEQLDVWADRARAELVKGKEGADPGSVVFEAVKRGRESAADVVIADTAGRLHTKMPLMEELQKVKRVIDKALPGAPHEVLLVLDATNGQNAIAQAKQFHEAVGVTSIALTKLDGTAKGGVVIGICDELKIPVAWVGVGETVEDLQPFDPKAFVEALFQS